MPPIPIRTILTHRRPHLDEIMGLWLLRQYGETRFPDVATARLDYLGSGGDMKGRSAEECEAEGILLLGMGGGRFDEHHGNGGARKTSETCATLVARELVLENDPALTKLLDFVRTTDLKGGAPFDLAGMVKTMHTVHPENPELVIAWTIQAIEAKYEEQKAFFAIRDEFEKNAEIGMIPGPYGKDIPVVAIASGSEGMNAFARSEYGAKAAIVIQRHPNGQTQIYTGRPYRLSLAELARLVRIKERQEKHLPPLTDWRALEAEGRVEGAEEWFYFSEGEMLLNGSTTAPDVPPTRLSLSILKWIVGVAMNPQSFEPRRAKDCLEGTCNSTPHHPCPWYSWGLDRCREIRRQMHAEGRRPNGTR